MNFKRSFYKQIVKSQHLLTICKVYKRILQKISILYFIYNYIKAVRQKNTTQKPFRKKGRAFVLWPENKPGSVMTAIYLRCRSPVQLKKCHLCEERRADTFAFCTVLLRIGFTGFLRYRRKRWALTSPFHPYRKKCGGISLLHFPWGRPRLPLAVILALGARTFLAPFLSKTGPLPSFPLTNEYYITNGFICQTD